MFNLLKILDDVVCFIWRLLFCKFEIIVVRFDVGFVVVVERLLIICQGFECVYRCYTISVDVV